MVCPQCRAEYGEGAVVCSGCHVPLANCLNEDPDVLLRTGILNPIAIGLAQCLLEEAGIPFFVVDAIPAVQQESGNAFCWWSVRVPSDREAEAREILQSVEDAK
jgi:hypothetical protein